MKSLRRFLPPFVISLLVLTGTFFGLRAECYLANAEGLGCFGILTPFVKTVLLFVSEHVKMHRSFIQNASLGGAFFLTMVGLLLLIMRKSSVWLLLYLAAVSISCVGEYFVFSRSMNQMVYAQCVSAALAILAFLAVRKTNPELLISNWRFSGTVQRPPRFSIPEGVFLAALGGLILAMRFYNVNFNPEHWDAETCPHRAIATSWDFIIQQELGAHVQQSSGLAWVALHKFFTRLNHPTLFDLDQRMISVGVSFINLSLTYFLMRRIFGVFTAFLALVVVGFGPLEIDWARQPTFHHFPVVIGLLMFWLSYIALVKRSWGAFLGVMGIIVLSKFVYPSAKTIAVGPFLAMAGVMIFDRARWRGEYSKWVLVCIGGVLFFLSRTIISYLYFGKWNWMMPIPMIQPAQTGTTLVATAQKLMNNSFDFFEEIFLGPVDRTHWTTHATIDPVRALPSVAVVFCTAAFARLLFTLRRPLTLLCVGLLLGGLVPGIVTGMAERRTGFALIFTTLLACSEIGWLFDRVLAPRLGKVMLGIKFLSVVILASVLCCFQTFSMFSRPTGPSVQLQTANVLRSLLSDGTLVVYLADERRCEAFYGILDKIVESEGAIGFATPFDDRRSMMEIINAPTPSSNTWYYRMVGLKSENPSVSWQKVLFVYFKAPHRAKLLSILKTKYPAGLLRSYRFDEYYKRTLIVYEVGLSRS